MHREYQGQPIEYTHFRTKKNSRVRIFVAIIMALSFVCVIYIFSLMQTPKDFIPDTLVTIEEGTTLQGASELLEEQNIIRSALLLQLLMQISEHQVIAGDYLFQDRETLLETAKRITVGQYGDVRVKAIIREGSSNVQIADLLADKLPRFDREEFLEEAKSLEGYLYPDTYFFFPSTETEDVIKILHDAFLNKMSDLSSHLLNSEHTLDEIIIMASIIEKEATTNKDERAVISGILWKRISKGMALQVDAPFVYELGKGSSDLTIADLRKDSPYNTYTNKGLTPTPIGNPSIGSIKAALNPTETPYLFYLHGSDRKVHYATNHEGHVNNKRNFLN